VGGKLNRDCKGPSRGQHTVQTRRREPE